MGIGLITGSSSGIGLETAVALAAKGHVVYATMRAPERSSELRGRAAEQGGDLRVLKLDVDDDASVNDAFEHVLSEHGHLDFLVNNAGVGTAGPVEERDIDDFRKTMETNFFGALRCIKAVLPAMRERRSGCIVNVSSVAGRVATSPQGAYTASKFALEGLSEVLAQEVKAFNIRVAIVEPGVIATPIFEKARTLPRATPYPQERRLHALNDAALAHPTSPAVVAGKIVEIVEGDSWKLRYPVGRDARPFITWRKMLTDEEWVSRHGEPDDDVWCDKIKQESGVDLRPFLDALQEGGPQQGSS